jgi:dipeptidyl aminopeptidase/acylaminoacyl peptidase
MEERRDLWMKPKKVLPYGMWSSPISSARLASSRNIADLAWAANGSLVWLERRSGRQVLVVQPADGQAPRDLNVEYAVSGHVGYGGGAFSVEGDQVMFVEAASGRLYRQPVGGGPLQPLTPAFGGAASPAISPDGRWILYVHTYEGQDCLAVVDQGGRFWPQRLAFGADFYMQPAWHPDGSRVAWVEWDHPNMPWDGTRLQVATLKVSPEGLPVLEDVQTIAGGDEIAIFQPQFSPDGRFLVYVSDQSGWWQIYRCSLLTGEHRQITDALAEHALPAWIQGMRTYDLTPDGRLVVFLRNQGGWVSLWQAGLEDREETQVPVEEHYTYLAQPRVSPDGMQVALIASGSTAATRLISLSLPTTKTKLPVAAQPATARILMRTSSEDLPAQVYASAQPVQWIGLDGGEVFGLFYPPANPDFEGLGKPPLIVMVHGGPTDQVFASFDLDVQFFTSRGYAVLLPNYRGSSGYGRAYRNALQGNWGIYDIQDSVSGARALVDQGGVDGGRMVIMGGSAGGFAVLKILEDYPDLFKAGVCRYPVSDQFQMAMETHKFEAHYNDRLIGQLPQSANLYRERSPIFFADRIRVPLAVFQGDEDRVVPPRQSNELVKILQRQGVPHVYHVYPGEGHGFHKPETTQHYYQAVDAFLRQYVIFT